MKDDLVEWTAAFFKNRDAFFKNIQKIEEKTSADVVVFYKDGKTQYVYMDPFMDDVEKNIETKQKSDHIIYVVANTANNQKKLVDRWSILKEYKFLCFYVVNPHSSQEKKWVVCPHTHDKICDPQTLPSGLASMAELVDEITAKTK